MGGSVSKPKVGAIVHYYDNDMPSDANNGVGRGPYPAIVMQHVGAEELTYVNLHVLMWGDKSFDEGTICHPIDFHPQTNWLMAKFWMDPNEKPWVF